MSAASTRRGKRLAEYEATHTKPGGKALRPEIVTYYDGKNAVEYPPPPPKNSANYPIWEEEELEYRLAQRNNAVRKLRNYERNYREKGLHQRANVSKAHANWIETLYKRGVTDSYGNSELSKAYYKLEDMVYPPRYGGTKRRRNRRNSTRKRM